MRLSSARRRCGQCRNYRRGALGRAQLSEACGSTLNKLKSCQRISSVRQFVFHPTAWLVDTRKSSLSRKTPRSRQRSRNPKATTRRPRRKRHWCSHVASAGRKCQIPRPSSSILRASTPRALFPQSWRAWRRERPGHQRHESRGSKTDDD
ncbi:hypothetical protein G5714_018339 [Onychostoma macrolepis]|uniref:Uncharacterized protein n=1 Tax=Onychostoma macrolepis TaxID=369639 RepID=A0A7J6C060_9TELE|nr:hypothetical protein G5714_018339 [Onychostoma macrolepis]